MNKGKKRKGEYESYCFWNYIKINLHPESIVNTLSALGAPWENCSQRILGEVVDLELCLEKEKALSPGHYRDNSKPLAKSLLLRSITSFDTKQSLVRNFKRSRGELANQRNVRRF